MLLRCGFGYGIPGGVLSHHTSVERFEIVPYQRALPHEFVMMYPGNPRLRPSYRNRMQLPPWAQSKGLTEHDEGRART
jgi:hypothetical protein